MQDGALSYSGIWPGNLNRLLLCPPFIAQILLELYIVGLGFVIKGHTLKTRHFMHVIVRRYVKWMRYRGEYKTQLEVEFDDANQQSRRRRCRQRRDTILKIKF